jgi:hypothetical protein
LFTRVATAALAAQVELQVRQWKSWCGVTDVFLDGAPGNPYNTLPTCWPHEVKLVRAGCR